MGACFVCECSISLHFHQEQDPPGRPAWQERSREHQESPAQQRLPSSSRHQYESFTINSHVHTQKNMAKRRNPKHLSPSSLYKSGIHTFNTQHTAKLGRRPTTACAHTRMRHTPREHMRRITHERPSARRSRSDVNLANMM